MAKVGDDLFEQQGITIDVHCGRCGYCLYKRSYIGRCPECGNEYDARPQHRTGIFLPREVRFPWSPLLLALVCTALGGPLLHLAVNRAITLAYMPAIPFLLFALGFFASAGVKIAAYWRERSLTRHVERSSIERDA